MAGPIPVAPAGPRRPGGRQIIWGLLCMVVLAPAVLVGAIALGVFLDRVPTSPSISYPGPSSITLEPGDHMVMGPYNGSPLGDFVVVTGPQGPVTTRSLNGYISSGIETVQDGQRYEAIAAFTAPTAGSYEVSSSREPPDETRTMLVAPRRNGDRTVLGVLVGLGLSTIIGVAGLVLFIVGLVRRSRRPAAPAGPWAGPPGAAPQPGYAAQAGYAAQPGYAGQAGSPSPGYPAQPPPAPPTPAPPPSDPPPPGSPPPGFPPPG